MELLHIAVFVTSEADAVDAPVADSALFMCAFCTQLKRPERPRSRCGALLGRLGHDFKLVNAESLLAMRGPETVGAGVAAPNDHHTLALRMNLDGGVNGISFTPAILLGQKFHRVVNALQFAAGDIQIAWLFGSSGKKNGVELLRETLNGNIHADMRVGDEGDPFSAHLLNAPIEHVFFKLEVGNAVTQKAANAIVLLVDGHGMAGASQLL